MTHEPDRRNTKHRSLARLSLYGMDGEPIYYRVPNELWNISSGPQNCTNFILKFYLYLPKGNKKSKYAKQRERLLLAYCICVCLSRSFVLTLCCVLIWVTKILMRAMLNVHAGRKFPTTAIWGNRQEQNCWTPLHARRLFTRKDNAIIHVIQVFRQRIYQGWPNLLYVWAAYRKIQVTKSRNIKI